MKERFQRWCFVRWPLIRARKFEEHGFHRWWIRSCGLKSASNLLIRATKSETEESEQFHFLPIPFNTGGRGCYSLPPVPSLPQNCDLHVFHNGEINLTPEYVGLNQHLPASTDPSTTSQVTHAQVTENLKTETRINKRFKSYDNQILKFDKFVLHVNETDFSVKKS